MLKYLTNIINDFLEFTRLNGKCYCTYDRIHNRKILKIDFLSG